MSALPALFGVPVDAAYHVVAGLAGALAPLPWGLAVPAAIVLVTLAVRMLLLPLSLRAMRGMEAQARVAPLVQAAYRKHAGQPDRLHRELSAVYQAEGTSASAGFLPVLAQWPVLSVLYLLFRSPRVGGARNVLLSHGLLGAPLGSHWLGGTGPLSAQGAVFAGLFLLLAAVGWLSARLARRLAPPAGGAGQSSSASPASPAGPASSASKSRSASQSRSAGKSRSAGQSSSGSPASPAGPASGALAILARLTPFLTVAVAAFVPLAAGLYLLTTTAWTMGERAILRRLSSFHGIARKRNT